MPIKLPNLDDRSYADLVSEARMLIPAHAPEWTNHNPSDPGITLIELFAYLTEILIYRLNRVTDANVRTFLKLIDGLERGPSDETDLPEEIRKVMTELRKQNRAVTSDDFEQIVLTIFSNEVARVRCVPRRDLELESEQERNMEKPGHISVIIVPLADDDDPAPTPNLDLIQAVKAELEPRRLLTTRLRVAGPRYATIGVRITVHINPDVKETDAHDSTLNALRDFFHPLRGGPDKKGWPFGRNVYVSEVYELLDRLPGVDFVEPTTDLEELTTDDPARKIIHQEELIGISISDDELVSLDISGDDIQIISPLTQSS